ncbi:MAG: dockerin type I repeat-containing protein [Paraprevotella sp.]|nr:dockerin type I repeat-containing protein [Paraprevotella sp.]
MYRELLWGLLLCLTVTARAQVNYEYRYWFDNAHGQVRTGQSTVNAWQMDVPTDDLSLGMHILHVQVKDTVWSAPVSRTFLKTSDRSGLACRYWFDEDKGEHHSVQTWGQGAFPIDVSHLDDGMHCVHFQLEGKGAPTLPTTNVFLKIPPTKGVDYMLCVADIDDKPFRQERVPASGGVVNWSLDATPLEPGLHRMQVRVVTPTGAASSSSNHFFFRTTTSQEMAEMKCYYSIDGEPVLSQAGSYGKGLFHFDVDVASLEDGLHRMAYFLASETGGSTRLNNAWFVKTPVGGNGIVRYDYWLNEQTEAATRVDLSSRRNPFDLISLLPVESVPVRSSSFQFELEDGHPVLYAKNDLHVRFYDIAGRFTDMTRSYVDYKVSRPVEEIFPLVSGTQLSKPCPAENGILWYRLDAVTGDSLTFRTTQAASVQLFSPSGREVYSASGSASVAFGGCHAWEDGTYYLAVHDVTGTRGSTIGVDYVHIDKYAVLNATPDRFGVPSLVNISLTGNGFTDSTRVALCKGDKVYWAQQVSGSTAELTANFALDSVAVGAYDLRVCYTPVDSLVMPEYIHVEPADSMTDVSIKLEGNPHFLAGGTATYKVKITNKSNIPVFSLPFTLTIECEGNENNVPYLKFADDLGKATRESLTEYLSADMDKATIDMILHYLYGEDNDLSMFYVHKDSTSGRVYLVGDFVYPRIDANTSVSIPFTIKKVNHNITLYASTKKHWNLNSFVKKRPGGGSGSGSDGPGSGGDGSGSGGDGSGSGGDGSGSGGDGFGSGGDGSGSGGDGSGSDGDGSGSGGDGSGSGTGGSGTGTGGSGSSGGGTGGSGGGGTGGDSDDECCVKEALTCVFTLAEMATPILVDDLVSDCVFSYVKERAAGIFSDVLCSGESPDFSKMPKAPAPVLTDLTASMIQCAIDHYRDELVEAALDKALEKLAKGLGGKVLKAYKVGRDCVVKPYKAWVAGCGDDDDDDEDADPINSWDPNEIYGYRSESGSRYVKKGVRQLNYTIEFENSPEFATASAHEVVVTDTLDSRYFDLSSFAPTSLKISNRVVELDGEPSFVRTVDMRPEINAIAQVECDFNAHMGVARWYFSSLDPMTMEPTDNPMSGFLAVNTDEGNGIGEVAFNIDLKREFDDGSEIDNRASIVFDLNAPILTPAWTNVIDTVAPVSVLTGGVVKNDSILTLTWKGEDNRSGLWCYDLYVQDGVGTSWRKMAENVTDTLHDFRFYEGMDYGFCVMATDSAGNVERKELVREFVLESFKPGDANGDGKVDALDVTLVVQYYLTKRTLLNLDAADVVRDGVIDALDITRIQQINLKRNNIKIKRIRKRKNETE